MSWKYTPDVPVPVAAPARTTVQGGTTGGGWGALPGMARNAATSVQNSTQNAQSPLAHVIGTIIARAREIQANGQSAGVAPRPTPVQTMTPPTTTVQGGAAPISTPSAPAASDPMAGLDPGAVERERMRQALLSMILASANGTGIGTGLPVPTREGNWSTTDPNNQHVSWNTPQYAAAQALINIGNPNNVGQLTQGNLDFLAALAREQQLPRQ